MPKTILEVIGKNSASPALKSVTSSIGAVKAAVVAITAIIGVATAAYAKQEQAEAKLASVLKATGNAAGFTATQLKQYAAALQQATTYGDEEIINAQALLATFKNIKGEAFERTTEAILDMSSVMGQDLKTSTIQLGKAINDLNFSALTRSGVTFTDAEKEMITTLKEAGKTLEAQEIILSAVEGQFKGAAEASAQTFSGALKQLKNNTGDMLEEMGKFVSVLGKGLVQNLSKSTQKMTEFLKSAAFIEKVANIVAYLSASWEVLKKAFTPVVEAFKKAQSTAWEPIIELFKSLFGRTNEAGGAFEILRPIVTTLSVAFAVVGGTVKTLIDLVINVVKAIKGAGQTIASFSKFVTNPMTTSWSEVEKSAEGFMNTASKLSSDLTGDITDMVNTVVDSANRSFEATDPEELANKWNETFTATSESVKAGLSGMEDATETSISNMSDSIGEINDTKFTIFDKYKKHLEDGIRSTRQFETDFEGILQEMQSAASEVFSAIADIYNNQLSILEDNLDAQLDAIDIATQKELEIKGLADKTTKEQLEEELSDLQAQLEAARGVKAKAAIQEEIDEKEKELAKEKILEEAEAKKTALEQQAAIESYKIEKAQFVADRASSLASIAVSTAEGIMKAWASGNPIYAATVTALIAAAAAAQTASVLSQKAPEAPAFASGGITPGGTVLVGEQGPELVNLPAGSRVFSNSESSSMMSGTVIQNMTVVANDPETFRKMLAKQSRLETARGTA